MSDNLDQAVELDMFGLPLLPIRDRRGRPSFAKSKENQEVVSVLRVAEWSHERIARYLGCDEKTLRKYFSRELDAGADIVEAEALMVTYRQMRKGHSVSTGRILGMAEKASLKPAAPRQSAAPKAEKPGKKQQAVIDAHSAHKNSSWGELLQ